MKKLLASLFLCLVSVLANADNSLTSGTSVLFRGSTNLGAYPSHADCRAAAQARVVTVSTTYQCRENLTVAPVVTVPPPPPPPPPSTGAVEYQTTFDTDEYPLSENGRWYKAPNAWTYVRTQGGVAYGTNGVTNSYDDSVAFLPGFNPDQGVEATVQRNAGTVGPTHEVELWLRGGSDSNNLWGYELCFWRTGQVQLFLWRGPYGAVEEIYSVSTLPWTPNSELQTGDVIKAEIVGTTVKAWINGVLKVQANTSHYASGMPGIGFFIRPGGSNNLVSLTNARAWSN